MSRAAAILIILWCAAAAACGKGGDKPAPSASEAKGASTASAVVTVVDAAPPKVDRLRTVAVQDVPAGVEVEAASDGPLVVVAMLQVSFEGAPIARVMGGRIDPKVIEGEPRRITPLVSFYEAWAKSTPASGGRIVNVAIVPHLSAGVLLDVLGSFAAAGQRDFAMIVNAPDGPGALPVGMPDPAAPADPLGLVVTLEGDAAKLWSRSGSEGTAAAPKLVVARTDVDAWPKLRAALVEIWGRHGAPPGAAGRITIAAEDAVPARDVLAAVVTVRQHDNGSPLYADVRVERHVPAPSASAARRSGVDVVLLEEEAARYADLLTADSDDDSSGDMSRRRPGADLGADLNVLRDEPGSVAIGGTGGRGTRGTVGTAVGGGAIAGVDVRGPGDIDRPAGPVARISVRSKKVEGDSSLTADMVVRKVLSAYMGGLKRCYKRELTTNPTIRGNLTLRFTVNESGRTVAPRVDGPDDALDECVSGLMASWRFPIPKDVDDEPTEERVELVLALVPE